MEQLQSMQDDVFKVITHITFFNLFMNILWDKCKMR